MRADVPAPTAADGPGVAEASDRTARPDLTGPDA
jgi:hypothetical protein